MRIMKYCALIVMLVAPGLILANTYQQKCALCHGVDGVSKMPGVPKLVETKLTAEQIRVIIQNGRGKMPKITLGASQKDEVVQYIVTTIKK